ncbi:hypothetical protein BFP72_15295 [Reichenbachiella sp. 5M10]|uniref:hypothetical protein n=1 Tax=Reichenbachiella sp. 5M10 TaxID=1889772 RepID=UPI000C14B7F2|nr:hypothetical protein [Reichenbachiella sp. 5M10]PIB36670.1 hypothetical protein BFP72_15295 [Reichenbachiella sp. 5M10]
MIDLFNINKIKDALSDYLKVKIDLIKLDITEQLSNVLAQVIAYFIIILISSIVILFISLGLAFLINRELHSEYLGFMVVAGFYTICLAVVFTLLKSGKLKNFFEGKMMDTFNQKDKAEHE